MGEHAAIVGLDFEDDGGSGGLQEQKPPPEPDKVCTPTKPRPRRLGSLGDLSSLLQGLPEAGDGSTRPGTGATTPASFEPPSPRTPGTPGTPDHDGAASETDSQKILRKAKSWDELKPPEQQELLKKFLKCLACGKLEPKDQAPKNSLYCWEHQRALGALTAQEKRIAVEEATSKGFSEPAKEGFKKVERWIKFQQVCKEKGERLQILLLTYATNCPSAGRGSPRGVFDTMQTLEIISRATITDRGFKMIFMNQAQWLKHATTVLMMEGGLAQSKWDKYDEENGPELRETKDDVLHLAVHVEDFIMGFNRTSIEKQLAFSARVKRKFTDADIEKATQLTMTGHSAFTSNVFDSVSSAAAAALARSGGSVFVSGQGHGAFGGGTEDHMPICSASDKASEAGDGEQEDVKERKGYDVDRNRNRIHSNYIEKLDDLQKSGNDAVVAAQELLQAVNQDGDLANVPNVRNFKSTLVFRLELFKLVLAEDEVQTPTYLGHLAPEFEEMVTNMDAILAVFAEVLKAHPDGKGAAAIEMLNLRMKPIVANGAVPDFFAQAFEFYGFDGQTFDTAKGHNVKDILKSINSSRQTTVMEANIHGFIEKERQGKRPMPLGDMSVVIPLPQLRGNLDSVMEVTEELALKESEKRIVKSYKALQTLLKLLGSGTSELKGSVTNRKKKEVSKESQAEKQKMKNSKVEGKQANKDISQAKKVLEKLGNDVAPIFVFRGPAIRPMARFTSIDHFRQDVKNGKFMLTNGDSYIIDNVHKPLTDAIEDAALKQHVAIFKFQFPTSKQAQEVGRAQVPLQAKQGGAKLTPLLQELGPSNGAEPLLSTAPTGLKFDATCVFGFVEDMQYFGIEYEGFCNVRYTLRGDREVLVGHYADLHEFWNHYGGSKLEYPPGMKTQERVGKWLREAPLDVIKAMEESGITLQRGIVHAGNAIVVRSGSFVIERTLNGIATLGFRAMVPDFQGVFVEDVSRLANDAIANDPSRAKWLWWVTACKQTLEKSEKQKAVVVDGDDPQRKAKTYPPAPLFPASADSGKAVAGAGPKSDGTAAPTVGASAAPASDIGKSPIVGASAASKLDGGKAPNVDDAAAAPKLDGGKAQIVDAAAAPKLDGGTPQIVDAAAAPKLDGGTAPNVDALAAPELDGGTAQIVDAAPFAKPKSSAPPPPKTNLIAAIDDNEILGALGIDPYEKGKKEKKEKKQKKDEEEKDSAKRHKKSEKDDEEKASQKKRRKERDEDDDGRRRRRKA